jgi:uncharacterized protein YndB with AHSA1/START domain
MANVRTSIDIAVPPERVWELVTDLERLGEWVSIHRDFPQRPPAEVRKGTRVSRRSRWPVSRKSGPGYGPTCGVRVHTRPSLSWGFAACA